MHINTKDDRDLIKAALRTVLVEKIDEDGYLFDPVTADAAEELSDGTEHSVKELAEKMLEALPLDDLFDCFVQDGAVVFDDLEVAYVPGKGLFDVDFYREYKGHLVIVYETPINGEGSDTHEVYGYIKNGEIFEIKEWTPCSIGTLEEMLAR